MGRNEEGGVLTQKLNVALLAILLVLTAGMAATLVADDSSADGTGSGTVELGAYSIGQAKTTEATLSFNDSADNVSSVEWSAKLVNSSGTTQSSALSKSSGYLTKSDSTWSDSITVTAPSTSGDYTLQVTYTEKYTDSTTVTYEAKATLHVLDPITLTVNLTNSGTLAINNAKVYLYVDGAKVADENVDDNAKTLTVEAGATATLTYKYYNANLSSGAHTYYVTAGDASYTLSGLEEEKTFYYNQGNLDYMNWIMILLIVIIAIVGVWVYRKPVKNYGKPKARR